MANISVNIYYSKEYAKETPDIRGQVDKRFGWYGLVYARFMWKNMLKSTNTHVQYIYYII